MAQPHRSPRRDPGGRRARPWLVGAALVVAAVGVGVAGMAVTLAVALPIGASATGAETVSDCSTTTGVIVVVDFSHWGGHIEKACAPDPAAGSTDGLQALRTAGFAAIGVQQYGTAFVCRITDPANGVAEPTQTQTSCVNTPPASAYWSYWHADPGQTTWSYSTKPATTYKPPPGGVTAWVFGGTSLTGGSGTGRPAFTPTQVRATNTTPVGGGATTTPPTTSPATPTTTIVAPVTPTTAGVTSPAPGATATTGPAAGGGGGTSGGASTSTGPTTTTSTTAAGATTTTAPPAAGTTTTTSASGGKPTKAAPKIVDVKPTADRTKASSGSPLPVVIGAVAVVVLGGGAALVAWRRRRASQAG